MEPKYSKQKISEIDESKYKIFLYLQSKKVNTDTLRLHLDKLPGIEAISVTYTGGNGGSIFRKVFENRYFSIFSIEEYLPLDATPKFDDNLNQIKFIINPKHNNIDEFACIISFLCNNINPPQKEILRAKNI